MGTVYGWAELSSSWAEISPSWRSLVFTNGCFDLLHVGHLRYLKAAKALGKTLMVGINSDRSVQALKGSNRPVVPEQERAELIAGLGCVDGVVIFDQPTAQQVIELLLPDIYVKGGDYQLATLPEANTVLSYGGRVELIAVEIPTSTSKIITTILQRYGS
ncbi:MAG: D-glycero-beta-D-manno-heptose 1-phosphate adenylyltransferase [Pseudanabaenaceae cyanobacterium bins.68]|nr:D-glycero-beta-D-manno-heptose 1-phosphate adenylyltransferase [Pseudanabaenaceae cyanobacterium bins.68]